MDSKSTNKIFLFALTINILIATGVSLFSDKKFFIVDKFQFVVSEWHGLVIICLTISYVVFFMVENRLGEKNHFCLNKKVLLTVFLSLLVLWGAMYPSFSPINPILLISFGIAFNIGISFVILLSLFCFIFKKNK